MPVALPDLLDDELVALDLRAPDRDGACAELVRLLGRNGRLAEPAKFLEAVLARESGMSTALGQGVAFPHARGNAVERIMLVIGRSETGIVWGNERVHLVFLIGVPQRLVQDYLKCVGALARIVKNEGARTELLQVKTASEFNAILRREQAAGAL